MRTCSARALVQEREHHGIDAHGLARAGGAGDQQMRHARQVGDHRRTANVLAERQRQGRGHLVVGLALDDLTERDHLALFIRDLKAHHRLSGNHLDHAYAGGGQRAGQVLGESRDLACLDARGRAHLEAGDDRARVHGDHFDVDAEVLELELHQARHRFQRFVRVRGFARTRIIQQSQRRQFAGLRRIEQRHLALFLGALALGRGRRRRLDAWWRARADLLGFGLARVHAGLLAFAPDTDLARRMPTLAQVADGAPHRRTDPVDHAQPGNSEGDRRAGRPDGQQHQSCAQQVQSSGESTADRGADDAARAGRQVGRIPVQRSERATAHQQYRKAQRADREIGPRTGLGRRARACHAHRHDAEGQRQQEGRAPKEKVQQVRQVSAGAADAVMDALANAGRGKTRIAWIKAKERHQHHQRDYADADAGPFAQATQHRGRETRRRLRRCRRIAQYLALINL